MAIVSLSESARPSATRWAEWWATRWALGSLRPSGTKAGPARILQPRCRGSCSREWPIPDAMRLPVLAVLLAHELFIGVVVAFEPAHAAVALEDEEVGRDAVEEPAVVADNDDAARELEDRLFERAQRVHVKVVRRLVEQQHVGAGLEHLREMDTVALTA